MIGKETLKAFVDNPAWQEFITDIEERKWSIQRQMEQAPKDTILFQNENGQFMRNNGIEFLQGEILELNFVLEWVNLIKDQLNEREDENA